MKTVPTSPNQLQRRIHPHTIVAVNQIKIQKVIKLFRACLPKKFYVKNNGVSFMSRTEDLVSKSPLGLAVFSGMTPTEAILFLAEKFDIPITYLD